MEVFPVVWLLELYSNSSLELSLNSFEGYALLLAPFVPDPLDLLLNFCSSLSIYAL